jgi:dihydrofolate synthase/folylpolyglutamate synthase
MEGELHPILQHSLELRSMKLGLERMGTIDRLLGSPSKQFPSVLVAGTNGKGSVTTKIARALQANGKKIGLYTSPHIHTYHERIQVNGKAIDEELSDIYLKKILEISPDRPSYFEILTLLAFLHFSKEKIDVAILEVGMGGRLDATNIVSPILSVITSIDYDHMLYLGASLEQIAFEKAGIIKPGVPVILGPNAKPLTIFKKAAQAAGSPLFQVTGSFNHYDEENSAIALKALSLLPYPLEKRSIEKGLAAVPPCRFEIISQDPLIILDVAHNPDGLNRLFERVTFHYPGKKVHVLAGFSADKDLAGAITIIRRHTDIFHLAYTDHPRLLQMGEPIELAFENAYIQAKEQEAILLICGSFFIMDKAKQLAARLTKEKQVD